MDMKTVLLVLVLAYVGSCLVLPQPSKVKKQHINGRPRGGFVPKKRVQTLNSAVSGDQYIDAKVDHFNTSNMNTYKQRYWYNKQWYKQGGPVFVYINGEAAGSGDWIAGDSQLTTLASELGAFTFSLEHRYYGASQVTNDPTNMMYLSSRQALADLADFIPAMTAKYNLQGAKWVSFGGSYAGALAAWSRMLYPSLIFSAVASSGPVQAVVDFTGYLEVVDDVLNTYTMNNINCGQTLKDALTQVQTLLTTANGRQQLFKGFKTCQPLNASDGNLMGNFYSSILDGIMGAVQYGYYDEPCGTLTNSNMGDALARLEAYNSQSLGGSCLDIDYNDMITEIKEDSEYFNWIYQTCNEFGYYQTTDSAKDMGFYGNIIPVNWYVQQCVPLYGMNFGNSSVYSNIANTNMNYHGQNGYNGTMVILPNGLADPWHVLGVLTAPNTMDQTVLIAGASHCADMDGDSVEDTPALAAAKKQIRAYVHAWFNQ